MGERPERGTKIVLHLREGKDDLLNKWRLRSIIEKYSDHISVPILMTGTVALLAARVPKLRTAVQDAKKRDTPTSSSKGLTVAMLEHACLCAY